MDIFIRDFPKEIHKKLKIMAAEKEMTLKDLIIKILDAYKNGEYNKS